MCLNKVLNMLRVLNFPKFWIWQSSEYGRVLKCECYITCWIRQNIPWQSSEYILGSKYARSLNMAGFWIWQQHGLLNTVDHVFSRPWQELHRVLNMLKYDWICLNRMWICLNMSEFSIIDRILNMHHTINSARSL